MDRITNKHLEAKIDTINRMLGRPMEPWTKNGDGKYHANIGNYHLAGSYGRVEVQEIVNEGGGVNAPSGLCTKRALNDWLRAFIYGLEAKKAC